MKQIRVSLVMIGATVLLLTFAVLSTSALADQGVITSWNAAQGTGSVTSRDLEGKDIAVRKEQFSQSCQKNGSLRKGQVVQFDIIEGGPNGLAVRNITCK